MQPSPAKPATRGAIAVRRLDAAIACVVATLAILTSTTQAQRPQAWNITSQVAPLYDQLDAGFPARLMVIGDSISFRIESWHRRLQDRFWTDFGIAGDGYRGLSNGFGSPQAASIFRPNLNGTWGGGAENIIRARVSGTRLNDADGNPQPFGVYSPDGIYIRLKDTGEFRIDAYSDALVIHHLRFPGGGDIEVRLDDTVILTIPTHEDTPDGEPRHAAATLAIEHDSSFAQRLILTSADERWVHINGVDMIDLFEPGFSLLRLARGGAGPEDFVLSDNAAAREQLAALAPQLIIVMLDANAGRFGTLYDSDMRAYLDVVQAALPDTPIILQSHHPAQGRHPSEADTLFQIAQERNMGFINLVDEFEDLSDMQDAGMMADNIHLSFEGGDYFGDVVYNILSRARSCPADLDFSGSLNVFDALAFLADFDAQRPTANLAADTPAAAEAFNVFDVFAFLQLLEAGCDE